MNRVDVALAEALKCGDCEGAENWYIRKHRWIDRRAKRHGVSLDVACAAYATMSQNNSVANNDRVFEGWLATGEVWMMDTVARRVRLAEAGDIDGALTFKNAAKITTFADNLRRPWAFAGATIDRHAADVVTGDRVKSKNILARVRLIGYRFIERQYIRTAERVGMLPSGVQARVWCHHVYCGGNV